MRFSKLIFVALNNQLGKEIFDWVGKNAQFPKTVFFDLQEAVERASDLEDATIIVIPGQDDGADLLAKSETALEMYGVPFLFIISGNIEELEVGLSRRPHFSALKWPFHWETFQLAISEINKKKELIGKVLNLTGPIKSVSSPSQNSESELTLSQAPMENEKLIEGLCQTVNRILTTRENLDLIETLLFELCEYSGLSGIYVVKFNEDVDSSTDEVPDPALWASSANSDSKVMNLLMAKLLKTGKRELFRDLDPTGFSSIELSGPQCKGPESVDYREIPRGMTLARIMDGRRLWGIVGLQGKKDAILIPGRIGYILRLLLSNLVWAISVRRSENELIENLDRVQLITDSLPICVAYAGRDRRYSYVNKTFERWFGRPASSVIGKNIGEILEPKYFDTGASTANRALEGYEVSFEQKLSFPDGAVRDLNILAIPHFTEKGLVKGYFVVASDITEKKINERALQETIVKYRSLFESMQDGVVILQAVENGSDFIIVDLNASAEKLEKLDGNFLIGAKVTERFPALIDTGLFDILKRVYRTGQPERTPLSIVRDGVIEAWRDNYVYKLPSGEVVLVYTDETARKRAEMAVKESETRYKNLAENSLTGICLMNKEGFIYTNERLQRILGRTKQELSKSSLERYLHGEESKGYLSDLKKIRTGESVESQRELKISGPGGQNRWINLWMTKAHLGKDETIIANVVDITERKKAREAFLESEGRVRAIFESAAQCVYIKDTGLLYTEVNPTMEKLFGMTAKEFQGKTDIDLFGPEVGSYLHQIDQRVLQGEVVEHEHTRTVNNSELTFLETRVRITTDDGKVVGICGIARNITERRNPSIKPALGNDKRSSSLIGPIEEMALIAAKTDGNILLLGETGAGKDYLAKFIHGRSSRCSGPFLTLNCAAVNSSLAESELFGHEPGSFTGAGARRRGVLELAEGGVLLLNEIGEMPLELQAKLLTFLDDRSFHRVGGEKAIRVNVRIIAATNRDIVKEVKEGKFREDLYHRLNVLTIRVPPLRERCACERI